MNEGIKTGDQIGDVGVLKTGTFLDDLTGISGIPRERITEFFGEEKTGKSTASFQVIAAAQQQGLRCLLVDVEFSYTPKYAADLGVDNKKLHVLRKQFAEEIIDATEEAITSGKYDVVVLDSIGSLSSRVEAEKASGEKTIGVQASLMGRFVRKLAPQVAYRKMVFIGINHTRVDLMTGKVFTMGGKLWSEKKKLSIQFKEKSGVLLKSGENVVGKMINVRVMKNAVGPTERKEMDVPLIFGEGFSSSANIMQQAIDRGVFERTGNTFSFSQEKIGTIGKLREWMKDAAHEAAVKAALV